MKKKKTLEDELRKKRRKLRKKLKKAGFDPRGILNGSSLESLNGEVKVWAAELLETVNVSRGLAKANASMNRAHNVKIKEGSIRAREVSGGLPSLGKKT